MTSSSARLLAGTGVRAGHPVHANLAAPALTAHAVRRGEGTLSAVAGGGKWRMVAVDVDGCDLAPAREGEVLRVDWSAPVSDAMEVRTELVRLARTARARF